MKIQDYKVRIELRSERFGSDALVITDMQQPIAKDLFFNYNYEYFDLLFNNQLLITGRFDYDTELAWYLTSSTPAQAVIHNIFDKKYCAIIESYKSHVISIKKQQNMYLQQLANKIAAIESFCKHYEVL